MARQFRRRRSGSRKPTTWNQFGLQMSLVSAGTINFFDLTPVPLLNDVGPDHGTAVCKRMILTFDLFQEAQVANITQEMGVGIYVANADAVDASAIQAPLGPDEAQFDWYYWSARGLMQETTRTGQLSWAVDISSMRKLRAQQRLIITAQASTGNSVDMELTVGARLLWSISN